MDKLELKKPTFTKIKDINAGHHCYHVYGKIVKATATETTRASGDKVNIVEGVIADETGCASFHFEGSNVDHVTQGAVVAIRNGRSEVVNEHIRLEVDKFGKISKEDAGLIKTTNTSNDISAEAYVKTAPKRSSNRN